MTVNYELESPFAADTYRFRYVNDNSNCIEEEYHIEYNHPTTGWGPDPDNVVTINPGTPNPQILSAVVKYVDIDV